MMIFMDKPVDNIFFKCGENFREYFMTPLLLKNTRLAEYENSPLQP